MVTVFDADRFVQESGCSGLTVRMKVLYDANRLSVRLRGRLIFEDRCEGWKNGPVYPALWSNQNLQGSTKALSEADRAILTFVCRKLGRVSGKHLSARSHGFREWIEARKGITDRARGNNPITFVTIQEAIRKEEDGFYIDERGYAVQSVFISNSRLKELRFYASSILPLVQQQAAKE
jgi:uncharacterized phage-associated protein